MTDKMNQIRKIIRPDLLNLQPYTCARHEYSDQKAVFLDANENAYGSVIPGRNNRYPDPDQKRIKQILAARKRLSVENIFIGNGSDEVIDLVIRAFCLPGRDKIAVLPPTYGMYKVCADINGIKTVEVPLDRQFQLNVQAVSGLDSATRVVFICSPNNPTGNLINKGGINELLARFAGIVVIDEAYLDFSPDTGWLGKLKDWPNLCVMQTFSKAWGMAGIRLGILYGNREVVRILNNIKLPYNVNSLSQRAVLRGLKKTGKMRRRVRKILQQKEGLMKKLKSMGVVRKIFPSDANFLLVRVDSPGNLYRFLKDQGIIVRDRSSQPGCTGCLRITVGTRRENTRLIKVLKKWERGGGK